jgi:hypothetical protein
VLLNDSNTLTITEVGNHDISQPIRVYFIEPSGSPLVNITGATGVSSGGSFSFGPIATSVARAFNQTNGLFDGPSVLLGPGFFSSSNKDFGSAMNIKGADASVSYANIISAYTTLGLGTPQLFQIEEATIPVGFNSDLDSLTLNGSFGVGTVIAPLAVNVSVGNDGKLTFTTFDTSWTNAGLVNQFSTVPEPSTWAMFLTGFAVIAGLGRRTKKRIALD